MLAAAIYIEADAIITFNTDDFPDGRLRPYSVEALHPDPFVEQLLDRFPRAVIDAAARHRASLARPPKTTEEYLSLLRSSGLDTAADRLSDHCEQL
ncbi:MAG: hypothetical protein ABEL51_16380 [Salinibacter sp.]